MNNKQNKGITLVALVITIIVLIILAAVSISAVMNEGLIKNAKEAKNAYNNSTKKEKTQLSTLLAEIEHYDLPDVVAGGYTGTSNAKYKDVNGQIAIIPAGFTVSNIESEKTISGGLVIYSGEVTDWTTDSDLDEIVDVQESHNQYVWIPVENPSEDMYGTLDSTVDGIEGTKFGRLYFKTNTNIGAETVVNLPTGNGYKADNAREPAVLAEYSSKDSLLGLKEEFNNMITSVEKYKGFYIGRYELTSEYDADSGISTPTVEKGLYPFSSNWFTLYEKCTILETENDKVRTSMIWGCQWDQAVKKCIEFDNLYLTSHSNLYGVYADSRITTKGVSGRMEAAYNIYDMGGNYFDWTIEAYGSNLRVFRGGNYESGASNQPASHRGGGVASSMYKNGRWLPCSALHCIVKHVILIVRT